jgi:predicted ThiF/HesA family dinucleotide-utilizing enzyme|tara:strand:+ start:304 stop:588 length:285 start_codon:yes stop_codon:yes gene_type:complete
MATPTYPSTHRSQPAYKSTGDYNRITKVDSSTTFHATGSNAGAGFIVEVVTNVVIHAAGGGTLPASAMLVDTVYPIGVKKVVIGSSGIVHVLHR